MTHLTDHDLDHLDMVAAKMAPDTTQVMHPDRQ